MEETAIGQGIETALCRADENGAFSAPVWVELLPAGTTVLGRDGRKFLKDSPEKIVAAFEANQASIPVDIEHSTEKLAPQGLPAPAAGWIEAMEIRRGGAVFGRVSWTPEGLSAVRNRNYRFLSPVLACERKTMRVMAVTSVALTNQPNLFLTALNQKENRKMALPEVAKALGLTENAKEGDIITALNRMKADLESARSAAPSLDRFVPREDYDIVLTRANSVEAALAALNQAQADAAIEASVEDAVRQGKITPATADYHKAQCRTSGGLERFVAFCSSAPRLIRDSGLAGKKPVDKGCGMLDDVQKAVNVQTGISDETFRKFNG